jgi:predicted ester cyclase
MSENERIVRAMNEAFNRHDFEAAAALIAPNAQNHGETVGRQGFQFVWGDICTRSPDVKLEILNAVADGEWVVTRNLYSGTHSGVQRIPVDGGFLAGIEPTGRAFSVQHIHMYRVQDGLITEHWANRDDILMMEQLGLPLQVKSPAKRPH